MELKKMQIDEKNRPKMDSKFNQFQSFGAMGMTYL